MGESVTEQSTLARNNFVGRERELAELVSACETGADSDAHLFLISGEPGIGKTRLADELASRAKARGMQVTWGRCWEGDGAPAYWPWIQVIRGFLGALDPERRHLTLESEIASDIIQQVAQIVPEMRPAQSSFRPPATVKLEPDEARFRLFDAVTSFLKAGARSHPILIVLDDLHDADPASLAMLRFFVRELKTAPILVIATYRDAEVRRAKDLSQLIGEVSRDAHSIPMCGLNALEVKRFVQSSAGRTPDETLVSKLCAATNGNPLFLDGVVRILISEGALDSAGAPRARFKIPVGVREAIRLRLGSISPDANSLLSVAAAIGIEFDFDLCRSVAEVSEHAVRHLLNEVSSAGIATELDSDRYRFAHALIRDAVYDGLDSDARIQIHAKIASHMENQYRENIDTHATELAHHFREAGVAEKAINYSIRAGQAALSVLAFSDAMTQWQAAQNLMEKHGSDAKRRADLLAWLSRVAFQVDRAASLKYGEAAIALYEGIGRFDKAAEIHVHLGTIFHMRGEPIFNETLASEHLRRAEAILAEGPETHHIADLYHVIAANEAHKLNVVGTNRAAQRAMEVADRVGARSLWAHAAAFYAWSLAMRGKLSEGFALFKRANEAAVRAGSFCFPAGWGAGFVSRWLGDPRGARVWYERVLSRLSKEAAPLPYTTASDWIFGTFFDEGQVLKIQEIYGSEDPAVRFWIGGEWEAAATVLENEVDLGDRTGARTGSIEQCISAGLACFYLGQHARAERLFKYGLDDADRGDLVLLEMRARPWLARLYVMMNRIDEAAAQVARCRQIMAAGEDWRGLVGTVARAEAAVESARGNHEIACRLLESALAIHRTYHAAWDEAETLELWGRVLVAGGDRSGACEKLDAAIENYRSRGVGPRAIDWLMAEKMRALGPSPTQIDLGVNGHHLSGKLNSMGSFRREGEFWTVTYAGATFRLKDAKGLRYISYLLARPRQRIHVRDLIEAVEGCAAGRRTTIDARSEDLEIVPDIGGPGPTLDARARSEYRTRLRDLHSELDEAERMNDLGRSECLRTEIEMVEQELTGSSGLGGRARAASDSAERARGLVGKNIRSVLQKIRHEHPALGRYFVAAIITGNFCAYQPEPDQPISWQF